MSENAVQVAPADYVTIALAAAITGLSVKAIQRKIEDGKWVEGGEYRRAPDGHIFVSLQGYRRWVEKGAGSRRAARASGSSSSSTASSGENA